MESSQLLNVLINAFYYVILITGVLVTGFIVYAGIFDDGIGIVVDKATGVIINDKYEASLGMKDYGKIALTIIEMVLFIKAIFHLRKATLKMIKGEMFDELVVKNLKLTGISMIAYKAVNILREQYSSVVYNGELTFGLDFEGFESFIFILILGLFFLLLSSVIQRGMTLQDENDLTI
jgi:hypothetical protein